MIKNIETPVTISDTYFFKPTTYCGIEDLGFNERGVFVVHLWSTPYEGPGEPRGTLSSYPPISPREYRDSHPTGPSATNAAFEVDGDTFILYDDWGKWHKFVTSPDIVQTLAAECRAQGLKEKVKDG